MRRAEIQQVRREEARALQIPAMGAKAQQVLIQDQMADRELLLSVIRRLSLQMLPAVALLPRADQVPFVPLLQAEHFQ
jgi:hypothetical protein